MKSTLKHSIIFSGCLILLAQAIATAQDYATPAPAPEQDLTMDNNLLIQNNGAWDANAVGPGCSACGGGNACPPSWYTIQGVQVRSRSAPRHLMVTQESPATGTYTAMLAPGSPDDYHVYNNVSAYVTYPSGSIGPPLSTPSNVFDIKQFGMDSAAGYNMSLGHYLCRDRNNNDHFVEFSFWGFNSWLAETNLSGQLVPIYDEDEVYTATEAGLINLGEMLPTRADPEHFRGSLSTFFPRTTDFGLDGSATDGQRMLNLAFNNALLHSLSYRSRMNNFELNGRISPRGQQDRLVLHPDGRWRRECQPGTYMSYLYGVRFMQIDENLRFHSEGQGQWDDDWNQNTNTVAGQYDIVTHNNLLGLQIGTDMTFRKCRWTWGIQARVGPYLNFASQESNIEAHVTDGDPNRPAYFNSMTARRSEVALIGEVGFEATYKFRPNLVGRAGYNFMWINGLALAPEQLQFAANPVSQVNANGSIFSQGLTLGLEWLW